jgi:polyhydroxyalkanoate synthesis regulator phasin
LATQEKKQRLIDELVEQGKAKGKLTTKEINDVLEELEFDMEQIDRRTKRWKASTSTCCENLPSPSTSKRPMSNEQDLEVTLSAEGINIDDPVKVYLKEIGPRASADPRGGGAACHAYGRGRPQCPQAPFGSEPAPCGEHREAFMWAAACSSWT